MAILIDGREMKPREIVQAEQQQAAGQQQEVRGRKFMSRMISELDGRWAAGRRQAEDDEIARLEKLIERDRREAKLRRAGYRPAARSSGDAASEEPLRGAPRLGCGRSMLSRGCRRPGAAGATAAGKTGPHGGALRCGVLKTRRIQNPARGGMHRSGLIGVHTRKHDR
jgi:hypothetical protein